MAQLVTGDIAPDFTLNSNRGEISLSQTIKNAQKGVIVYFYPRAMTPGCTTEACDFRDSLQSLVAVGYAVIGISPDEITRLERFAEREALNFPLASDPEHKVMSVYGAYGEKNTYGKKTVGVIRSTVVIDTAGKVVLAQYNVRAKGHVARVRAQLHID